MHSRFNQRYQIIKPLGHGGEGSVFLVEDRLTKERYALKRLDWNHSSYRNEVALMKGVYHPGIANLLGIEIDDRRLPLFFYEYIEGVSLDQYAQSCSKVESFEIIAQLLGSLDFLHRRNILHRDIKPQNILISKDDLPRARLVDFGLAQTAGEVSDGGTVAYCAPELLAGEEASLSSDLYSIGVLLYQAIFKKLPYEKAGEQLLNDVVFPFGQASEAEIACCRRLLARYPKKRPQNATEALFELRAIWPENEKPRRVEDYLMGDGLAEPIFIENCRAFSALKDALNCFKEEKKLYRFELKGEKGSGKSRILRELRFRALESSLSIATSLKRFLGERDVRDYDQSAEGAVAVEYYVSTILKEAQDNPIVLLIDDLNDSFDARVLNVLANQNDAALFICVVKEEQSLTLRSYKELTLERFTSDSIKILVDSMLPEFFPRDALVENLTRYGLGNPKKTTTLLRSAAQAYLNGESPTLNEWLENTGRHSSDTSHLPRLNVAQLQVLATLALTGPLHHFQLKGVVERFLGKKAKLTIDRLMVLALIDLEDGCLRVRPTIGNYAIKALDTKTLERLTEYALSLMVDQLVDAAMTLSRAGMVKRDPELVLAAARKARHELLLSESLYLYRQIECMPFGDDTLNVQLEVAALRISLFMTQDALNGLLFALERSDKPHARLVEACADAYLRAGDISAGLDLIDRLGGYVVEEKERLIAIQAKLLVFAGRYEDALGIVDQIGKKTATKNEELQADIAHSCGLAAMYLGHYHEAEDAFIAAQDLLKQAGLIETIDAAKILNSYGLLAQRKFDLSEAHQLHEKSLFIAKAKGHLPYQVSFTLNLAIIYQQEGKDNKALRAYHEALRIARSYGAEREIAQIEHNLARLLAELGNFDRAIIHLESSKLIAKELELDGLLGYNEIVEAEIFIERNELVGAELCIERARKRLIGDDVALNDIVLIHARLLAERKHLKDAIALLEPLKKKSNLLVSQRISCEYLLGKVYASSQDADEVAKSHFNAALLLIENDSFNVLEYLIHDDLSDVLARRGESDLAKTHRDRAKLLFEKRYQSLDEDLKPFYIKLDRKNVLFQKNKENASIEDDVNVCHFAGDINSSFRKLDADLLAALLEINKKLNQAHDFKPLLDAIIDHAIELSGAERGFLLMRAFSSLEKEKLDIPVARNIDRETLTRKEFKISHSIAKDVFEKRAPTLSIDALGDPRFEEWKSVHQLKLRSVLCVPLFASGQIRGAIYLDNRFKDHAFGQRELERIQALCDVASIALSHVELLAEKEERKHELERLNQELIRANQELDQLTQDQNERIIELAALNQEQQELLTGRFRFRTMIGVSPKMQNVFKLLLKLKESAAPVLIYGESGTGKEVVARALHFEGDRKGNPFVAINCGALPKDLLESELFGHQKGAFTGAVKARKGVFERANGGTLFLDEIGDMPAELQVKLLRVLQEKRFERVGGEEELSSDFRLICASNKDLKQLVKDEVFRQDLYFRVNVVTIELPPLRERVEDIPLLIEHLLKKHEGDLSFSQKALERMQDYHWPGNIRELENELMRLMALKPKVVDVSSLSSGLKAKQKRKPKRGTLKDAIYRLEEDYVRACLRESKGKVTDAAKTLGMTRVGLHKLLKRHGIDAKSCR